MHDRDGRPLEVGDVVNVPCKITSIVSNSEHYCNVNVETVEPMYPGDSKTSISLNAKQTVFSMRDGQNVESNETVAADAQATSTELGSTDSGSGEGSGSDAEKVE